MDWKSKSSLFSMQQVEIYSFYENEYSGKKRFYMYKDYMNFFSCTKNIFFKLYNFYCFIILVGFVHLELSPSQHRNTFVGFNHFLLSAKINSTKNKDT